MNPVAAVLRSPVDAPVAAPAHHLAAVDVGSNSFWLEIGEWQAGRYRCIEAVKEAVRLGAGLDDDGVLSDGAAARGIDCLARFGARLAGFEAAQVRAVATQTLREARNRAGFIAVGSSRVDLQACKLEYSIVSPK